MSVRPGFSTLCFPLREDPDVAEVIPPDRRARAIEQCTAVELRLPPGGGTARGLPTLKGGLGLLVLGGLLIRHVGIEGRFGAELLGEGDLLRPWQTRSEAHV